MDTSTKIEKFALAQMVKFIRRPSCKADLRAEHESEIQLLKVVMDDQIASSCQD